MKVFQEELSIENSICSDTVISEITQNIDFRYFHNESDRHRVIRPSSEIEHEDQRYARVNKKLKIKGASFASDAKFLRGCIGINAKS